MVKKALIILFIPLILFSQNAKNEKISQAEFFVANGELEKAIEVYNDVFKADPKDIKIARRLAELYLWTENVPGAISVYETLLKNDIVDYDVLTKLGQWYLWDGRQNDAISVYEKLIQMYPDSVDFYRSLAKLYVWGNQPKKAISIYEKIIKLDPFDYETMVQLAQQYVWNDQQLKAIPLYRKLVLAFPDSLSYHWMLCQLLVWNNKSDEAKEELEKFLKKFPQHKQAIELVVQLHYYSGEWDVAKKEAEELLEIDPQNQIARRIIDEIKANYSNYVLGETKWLRDSNKLTKIVSPIETRYFFNRFLEMKLNFERVELRDDRIQGKSYGYGGFAKMRYNLLRGIYFDFGAGAFKYGVNIFPVWDFSLGLSLFDRIYPQFTYKRIENREGVRAIEEKIFIDDFSFTIYNQVFPALGLSFLVEYGIYSDGNIKRTFAGYMNLTISKRNPQIMFVSFYAFENFDSIYVASIPYWTPNNLSTYWVEINFRQDILRWFSVGTAVAMVFARTGIERYPNSLNYRFFGEVKTRSFELYGLYERYGSTVYNYKAFRAYLKFQI